ncbi:MAG: TIGR00725 family protein [Bacillota bacterium]
MGVMGGGEGASPDDCRLAHRLGRLIAGEGWVLLNGGRAAGVMEASARGAKENGGLTVGILPDTGSGLASRYIDIPIATGMGDGRNYINVLSSDVVVALPGKAGTISEIALALKNRKKVILLRFDAGGLFEIYREKGLLKSAGSAEEAIQLIKTEYKSYMEE